MATSMRNFMLSALSQTSKRNFRCIRHITGRNAGTLSACLARSHLCTLKGIPSRSMCYEARKVDIAAVKQTFMFDTHALVRKLEAEGFSVGQAEAFVECLVQIVRANDDYQAKNMVTKAQQEIMMQQVMSHIAAVRKDMVILEKSEFSQLKHEYEKQGIDIKQLRQTLTDEVQKLKSGVTLDMSLERARVQEDHGNNERNLEKLNNKLEIQETEVQKRLSQVDSKIDKEVATLLTTFERYKTDNMKYAAGTIMTCLTVCLGFYRVLKG